ncbi:MULTISPECIES: YbaK/EbsC family protein [unclassified Saccharicrinis]|uniref:YbaK/EbsC family protein n=1 Tax=unclassified Saccharicrinis TaxID=2646859 RepID=UPI003D337951
MLKQIRNWLKSESIDFKEVHHEITKTSEESAEARGEDISIGGKALVIKIDGTFKILVLSAAKKLNSTAVKKYFSSKKMRFASKDELWELTGLVPGSVPPFGRPVIDLDLYVDNSILENDKIAFNAGSLTDSVVMKREDYVALAKPIVFSFSE